jgi:hypothetical protein
MAYLSSGGWNGLRFVDLSFNFGGRQALVCFLQFTSDVFANPFAGMSRSVKSTAGILLHTLGEIKQLVAPT